MRNTQLVEHISKELSVQTKLKNVGIWHQESCLRASSKYPKKQYNQTRKFLLNLNFVLQEQIKNGSSSGHQGLSVRIKHGRPHPPALNCYRVIVGN